MIRPFEPRTIIQKSKRILKQILLVAFIYSFTLSGVSWAATYEVGPDQAYPTIASVPPLNPGDIVNLHPGTYNEVKKWTATGTATSAITLQGVGTPRPVIDATGQDVSGRNGAPRAAWEIQGNYYLIQNLEFRNARNGNNGAGIRVLNANTTTVRNCKITYCDMGMMSSSNDNLLVEYCEVAYNGTSKYNGYSHNFYLAGGNTIVRFCYIHDALYGQNFKTRGHYTDLSYNYIADSNEGEVGPVDGTDTAAPTSNMTMIGNLVISKPNRTGNTSKFIDFGQDSGGSHNGTLYLINNTLIAGSPAIGFLRASAADSFIVAVNNVFYGSDTIVQAGYESRVNGNNNWIPSTAANPPGFGSTISGTSPGFVDTLLRDYYLSSASLCRNAGSNSPIYLDGAGVSHSGVPVSEYVRHVNSATRASDCCLDLGAYEYGTALPNQPPFVSAGPNQTVTLETGASLSGAIRDDGLPNPPAMVTTTWSTVSGRGTVTFGNANATHTTANFSRAGTYVLRLTARDSALSDFDDVTIVVTRH